MDLDPPGMGFYSSLIVTMGYLAPLTHSAYRGRQTDGRTDGHAPDNSPTYALMHYMHLHRWAKNKYLMKNFNGNWIEHIVNCNMKSGFRMFMLSSF